MSRAPFGRRKQKKPEFEPVPVVTGENAEAESPRPPVVTTPTEGGVTPSEDSKDIVHEFQRLPVKTLDLNNVEVSPMANIHQPFRHPSTEERTVIRGYNVETPQPEEDAPPQPLHGAIVNEVKGRETLLAAAQTPPQKKGEKKIIRG